MEPGVSSTFNVSAVIFDHGPEGSMGVPRDQIPGKLKDVRSLISWKNLLIHMCLLAVLPSKETIF